ncbi:hypothetical protein PGTUg99_029786 [Puccinia graminis f. sp. tritici]|uniref:Uncharacterized protein n=1 Tax=Puccinia graminis f. sp. tritici TaxID=56615 RepID=A0A5B0RP40_PUCGR|nr:hypothetical protein PGTUg99_029786 [Puccinia graminis f. sp. tritici]
MSSTRMWTRCTIFSINLTRDSSVKRLVIDDKVPKLVEGSRFKAYFQLGQNCRPNLSRLAISHPKEVFRIAPTVRKASARGYMHLRSLPLVVHDSDSPPQLTRPTLSSARQTSPVLYAPLNVDCRLSRSFSDKARDESYDCDLLSERPVS